MNYRSLSLALAAALASASPCLAAKSFTGQYSFGDSLSDSGNTFAVTYQTTPNPAYYWKGRWSNGPVFTELLTKSLYLTTTSSIQSYINYAYGGATAVKGSAVPSLVEQLQMFSALPSHAAVKNTDLFTVLAGANDIINALESSTPTNAVSAGTAAAGVVGDSVGTLAGLGAKNIVVLSLPNIGATPLFASNSTASALAKQASNTFNSTLETRLKSLRSSLASDVNLVRIDLDKVLSRIVTDYKALGFGNASTSYLTLAATSGTSIAGDPNKFVFFDPIHPSARTHAIIASIVTEALNPESVLATSGVMSSAIVTLDDVSRAAVTDRIDSLAKTPAAAHTGTNVYAAFNYGSGLADAGSGSISNPALRTTSRVYSVGGDVPVWSSLRLGVALSDDRLSASTLDRSFRFRVSGNTARAYAVWHTDAWTLASDFAMGDGKIRDIHRATAFGGLETSGSTKQNHWEAGLRAAYNKSFSRFSLSPFADLRYARAEPAGYTETGVEVLSFAYNEETVKSLVGTLGLQACSSTHVLGKELTFIAEFGGKGDLSRARHEMEGKLADNYTLMTNQVFDEDRNTEAFGGLRAILHLNKSLNIQLAGELERHNDYRLSAGIQAGF